MGEHHHQQEVHTPWLHQAPILWRGRHSESDEFCAQQTEAATLKFGYVRFQAYCLAQRLLESTALFLRRRTIPCGVPHPSAP